MRNHLDLNLDFSFAYLASDSQHMTELCLATTKLSVELCDRASFDPALEDVVQFFAACRYLTQGLSLHHHRSGGGESRGDQVALFQGCDDFVDLALSPKDAAGRSFRERDRTLDRDLPWPRSIP